ncbi:MAG TPA: alpha/beta hydrolase [Acidimicrobiales bacterium]|nr:alpha/beta hydrolase [Acidimicrobiales bacterium]
MLKAFDSGRLFGSAWGSSPAWVLALHGWRRTHDDFEKVLGQPGLDAVAVDLPGFGATPPPPEAWGSAEYAAALDGLLDQLANRVVVVGHSFGGRVAVHLAARRPDRVAALVLTGVPLFRVGPARRPATPYRLVRWAHRRGLIGDSRMETYRQRYGSEDYRMATGVMRQVHVRVVNETYDAQLARIACPVELVWGDDDTAAPLEVARQAAAALPDARLTVCPGAGHLTPLTAPEQLRAAVERNKP